MKNEENFSLMTTEQLMDMNGGGIAYDIGRVIRFIGIWGGGTNAGAIRAITDWQVNAVINEAENG